MNRDVSPTPEPDPRRLSLESLEEKLRALPLADVPDDLTSKLVAALPPAQAVGPLNGLPKPWPWIGAVGVLCITASVVGVWLIQVNSKPPKVPNENRNPPTATNEAPRTSKAVQDFEQTVRFDPYNADAWYGLAKAQAEMGHSTDAISSAQKAIDIGRSRNRTDFVNTVEAWLRSYRAAESRR
jgi:hypothetical protein